MVKSQWDDVSVVLGGGGDAGPMLGMIRKRAEDKMASIVSNFIWQAEGNSGLSTNHALGVALPSGAGIQGPVEEGRKAGERMPRLFLASYSEHLPGCCSPPKGTLAPLWVCGRLLCWASLIWPLSLQMGRREPAPLQVFMTPVVPL